MRCVCIRVLQGSDPALLNPHGDLEQPDCGEAAGMVLYLMVPVLPRYFNLLRLDTESFLLFLSFLKTIPRCL